MRNALLSLGVGLVLASAAAGQPAGTNYDEAKVPKYTLPDPLVFRDGKPVRNADDWARRRQQILNLFEICEYGRTPHQRLPKMSEIRNIDARALGGKAVRKQVTLYFAGKKDGPKGEMLLYLPANANGRVPVFLGLNFSGNQTVANDPGILPGDVWVLNPATKAMVRRPAEETSRGASSEAWQLDKILARGYGLATMYYGDIEPDFNGGIKYGVRPLFFEPGQTEPASDEWGAIGAWAWGMSRMLDYLVDQEKGVDPGRVAAFGHSRLGKTALWAAAQDRRFAMAISNDSGEGGAALSRRMYGETVRDLNTAFPHWFCTNYKKFSDHVNDLPVDQHELLALIAPRPVYVASAEEDRWADPKGEFLSAAAAGPVYRLLGRDDLGTNQMPAVHQPIQHTIGYHIRAGKHAVTAYDWEQYLAFADKNLK